MSKENLATILYVDDDDASRDAFTRLFRQEGFTVQEASTGSEALRLVAERPDLVILDVNLPDQSGFEVCRQIKNEPATSFIPVLHLSGMYISAESKIQGLEGGADGYLVKPVDPQELLAFTRALLRIRLAEKALQSSETRLQNILDNAPVVVQVKNIQGRYLLVNRLWEELFHLRRDRVIGKTAFDVHARERAELLRANDLKVLEGGGPLQCEETIPQDDGLHTYLSFKFPLYDAEGVLYAVGGFSSDITERNRITEALRESEALYHSLVESLPLSIFRKDLGGRFTFGNQRFCDTLGRPITDIIGRTDFDFYPPELAKKYTQDDARVTTTGEFFEEVERHQDPDSRRSYVEILKAPVRDARGRISGVQGIFWDVTARKLTEKELARATAEFTAARRIQQKLFPTATPHVAGLDIGGASFGFDIGGASYPAEAIGGDYYDYLPMLGDGLGIAIGDVSGHGLGPALLMAEVRAFLRAFAQTQEDVGAVVSYTNRILYGDIEEDRFITLLLARLDPRTRTLVFVSAGHQTGYVLDADGGIKVEMESTSIPLGIFPDTSFAPSPPIPLAAGDIVLLITDGIVESRAPDGLAFGTQRVLEVARLYRRLPAGEIVDNLYHAVRAFTQYQPQVDDITATVIKVGAAPTSPEPDQRAAN